MSAPPNLYAPPSGEDATATGLKRWWQRPSFWLGGLEIAGGLSVGLGGCLASLATDASLAGVGAVVALGFGVVVLVLPGVLLLGRHPLRWLGQIPPAVVVLWCLLTLLRPSGPH